MSLIDWFRSHPIFKRHPRLFGLALVVSGLISVFIMASEIWQGFSNEPLVPSLTSIGTHLPVIGRGFAIALWAAITLLIVGLQVAIWRAQPKKRQPPQGSGGLHGVEVVENELRTGTRLPPAIRRDEYVPNQGTPVEYRRWLPWTWSYQNVSNQETAHQNREAILVALGELKVEAAKVINEPAPDDSNERAGWLDDLEDRMNKWKSATETALGRLSAAEAANWKTIGTFHLQVRGINSRHTRIKSLTAERINRLGQIIDKWTRP